jgi:hypothetical protein
MNSIGTAGKVLLQGVHGTRALRGEFMPVNVVVRRAKLRKGVQTLACKYVTETRAYRGWCKHKNSFIKS